MTRNLLQRFAMSNGHHTTRATYQLKRSLPNGIFSDQGSVSRELSARTTSGGLSSRDANELLKSNFNTLQRLPLTAASPSLSVRRRCAAVPRGAVSERAVGVRLTVKAL